MGRELFRQGKFRDWHWNAALKFSVFMVLAVLAGSLAGVSPAADQTKVAADAPENPASAPLCISSDQLGCTCTTAPGAIVNDLVMPCFLGEPNREVFTQTDPFANNVFAALNWPKAADRGVPDLARTPGSAAVASDYVTTWESWPNTRALFRKDGAPPEAWGQAEAALPAACQTLVPETEMAKHAAAKVPAGSPLRLLDDYINPDGDALIDASGQPTRYEVLFNRQAFNYVRGNMLWDRAALDAFVAANGHVDFTPGTWQNGLSSRGAVVIKAAWKVLDPDKDDPANFHKSWAYVTPVVRDGVAVTGTCEIRPVALTAMHIALKTNLFEDWLWTTFEHIAIAPTWDEVAAVDAGQPPPYDGGDPNRSDWLFYSPVRSACLTCKAYSPLTHGVAVLGHHMPTLPSRIINEQPRGYYFPTDEDAPPEDTARTATLDPTVSAVELRSYRAMDELMAQGFAGTALRFYRLKGAQWKDPNGNKPNRPEILANAVLEAFSQSDSSCLSCHGEAGRTSSTQTGHPHDYIFALGQSGIGTTKDTQVSTSP